MRTKIHLKRHGVAALMCAGLLLVSSAAFAQAQQQVPPQSSPQDITPPQQPPSQNPLGQVGKWFEDTFSFLGTGLKGAQGNLDNLNREAGIAAKSAVGGAKDAADSLSRIPGARTVSGHVNCTRAPNGAPDCGGAAASLCKSKGFGGGTSIDMTTAEDCPVPVLMGRRAAEPGECKPVTFVTRALCQ